MQAELAPWWPAARVVVVEPLDVADVEQAANTNGKASAPTRSATGRRRRELVRTGRPYTCVRTGLAQPYWPSAPTTWVMHAHSAATSSGSMAGNMAMRSWFRPSLR